MSATTAYLLDMFAGEIKLEEKPSEQTVKHISDQFVIQFFTLHDVQYVLVEKKRSRDLVVEEYQQDQELIMKATRRIPVFVCKNLRLYQRKSLIKNRIPFVVPNSQIYIPTVMICLEERDAVAKDYGEKFAKSTQVVFSYLLLNPITEIITRRLAEILGYSATTVSRALQELYDRQLMNKIGSRTRAQYLIPNLRKFWEEGKRFLFNPIKDAHIFTQNKINYDTGLLYKSSYSALVGLSEAFRPDPDGYSYYVCYSNVFSQVHNNQIPMFPTMTPKDTAFIETMMYDPALLTKTDSLDLVSLYAYFVDKYGEEKIVAELDRIIKGKLSD